MIYKVKLSGYLKLLERFEKFYKPKLSLFYGITNLIISDAVELQKRRFYKLYNSFGSNCIYPMFYFILYTTLSRDSFI